MNRSKNISQRTKRRRKREELDTYNYFSSSDNRYNNDVPAIEENNCFDNNNYSIDGEKIPKLTNFTSDINDLEHFNHEYNININYQLSNDSDSMSSNSTSDNYVFNSIDIDIAQWALLYKIPHTALNGLLLILRKHQCFSKLPKDARTILHTKPIKKENIRDVQPGKYHHFGIATGILRHLSHDNTLLPEIKIVIGIDGLPISKSNSNQFYPILAYIRPNSSTVFPVGLYFGTEKPSDSNQYLNDFVNEAKFLVSNGILIQSKLYKVIIDVFCCDTPARAFVLRIKSHNGFFSCSRCEIEGEYKSNRMCFPYCAPNRQPRNRTHMRYMNRSQERHHLATIDNSHVTEIPGVDIVNNFSLDYMHMVCLGVTKKLILLWMKGPLCVRLPSWKIVELSNLILNLKSNFTCEFSRKPRRLEEVPRWKATEFRTFLVYVGPIILKGVVNDRCFKNFMSLNIAMIILLSPDFESLVDYAQELLNYFVKTFGQIYGEYLMSHNIHGLLHLVEDYKKYGPLDNCSTFPFENYMKVIKSMLRKPDKPLEQVIVRYNEGDLLKSKIEDTDRSINMSLLGTHNFGPLLDNTTNPQFNTLILGNFKIKCNIIEDSYFCTFKNEYVKLVNIAHSKTTGRPILIGRKFKEQHDLYSTPIKSSYLGIYVVKKLSNSLKCWNISEVKKKVVILSYSNYLISIPLLHSV